MSITHEEWLDVNQWEKNWWNDCINTYMEETKQLLASIHMGLNPKRDGRGVWIDLEEKRVLDVGGGVVSLLLKTKNRGRPCTVADPILFKAPEWVKARYKEAGIETTGAQAEMLDKKLLPVYDEVWMYNCLQHVEDPIAILKVIKQLAPAIRIFEWLDTLPSVGHPQTITKEMLDTELGIDIKTGEVSGAHAGYGYYLFGENK